MQSNNSLRQQQQPICRPLRILCPPDRCRVMSQPSMSCLTLFATGSSSSGSSGPASEELLPHSLTGPESQQQQTASATVAAAAAAAAALSHSAGYYLNSARAACSSDFAISFPKLAEHTSSSPSPSSSGLIGPKAALPFDSCPLSTLYPALSSGTTSAVAAVAAANNSTQLLQQQQQQQLSSSVSASAKCCCYSFLSIVRRQSCPVS